MAAVCGPTLCSAIRPRRRERDHLVELALEFADLVIESTEASAERAQDTRGGAQRVVAECGRQRGAALGGLLGLQRDQLLAQLVRGADDERADLQDRLGARLDRRLARDAQDPDRLDDAVAGLGLRAGTFGKHHACRGDRIGAVGLADVSTVLSGGASDLDDLDARRGEKPGQTGTVGASALNAGARDQAVAAGPRQQLVIAGARRGERRGRDRPANRIDDGSDVHVEVGVDAERDDRLVV